MEERREPSRTMRSCNTSWKNTPIEYPLSVVPCASAHLKHTSLFCVLFIFMKRVKDFLKKFLDKDVLLAILVILGLSIHFYYFNNLLFSKPENSAWIDVVNSIILLITLTTFSGFILIGLFSLITRDAESVEKWALRNLTKVCYFIAILIISSFIFRYLSTEQFLTSFWALIVFWYWYKTYERDKEIQMIERYSEKYNSAKTKLINSTEEEKKDYNELLTIWYEEYFLFEKWYISKELWNEWKFWIEEDISLFLYKAHANFDKSSNEYPIKNLPKEDWFVYCLDTSNFLDEVVITYSLESRNKILIKDEFWKFLISLIKDAFDKRKKLDYLYTNKDWIIWMDSLLNQDIK